MTKSKTIYSEGVGPLIGGVHVAPYPYWHALGVSADTPEEDIVRMATYQLELVLFQQTSPIDTGAFGSIDLANSCSAC